MYFNVGVLPCACHGFALPKFYTLSATCERFITLGIKKIKKIINSGGGVVKQSYFYHPDIEYYPITLQKLTNAYLFIY